MPGVGFAAFALLWAFLSISLAYCHDMNMFCFAANKTNTSPEMRDAGLRALPWPHVFEGMLYHID
jgi:hypothetical protein